MSFPPEEIARIAAQILVLFLGIGLHEYAHCKFADMAGDPTPRFYGRVTLNLFKHFEPVGTAMMVLSSLAGFGLGWGRPAPADPRKMNNPRWDFFASVAAGPLSNLVQATIYALFLRIYLRTAELALSGNIVQEFLLYFLIFGVAINIGLFFFNLIPFGPLDGHWLVGLLLPERQRWQWFKLNQQIGMPGLFIAILFLQFSNISITRGPVSWLFPILTGIPFPG